MGGFRLQMGRIGGLTRDRARCFITAPVLGYLNLRAVTSDDVPEADRPGPALIALAYVGLVSLGGTAVVYAVSRLIG